MQDPKSMWSGYDELGRISQLLVEGVDDRRTAGIGMAGVKMERGLPTFILCFVRNLRLGGA